MCKFKLVQSCLKVSVARGAFTDLHGLVENAAADLDHLQVLLLLVPRTLDVGHPAPLVLLAGVDEEAHAPVLVKHLRGRTRDTHR